MQVHPYYHSWQKRVFDLVVASSLLLLLLPLFFMISWAILLTAGWPIFYRQKRSGKNKQVFRMIKFRTMYVGAEKNQWRYKKKNVAPAPMYKNWADPRFVGVGKWLSKTGLDELPQLWNILRGEMSLVGPRPLPVYETDKLSKSWDYRYQVKPGIFSEWSVNVKKHNSLLEWKKLELKTLKRGGAKYEIKIIGQTLLKLIK